MHRLSALSCAALLGLLPAAAAEKERTLSLPLAAGARLRIDAGAGFLKVEGRDGQKTVEVQARIVEEGLDDGELEDFIRERVVLVLEATPQGARLRAEVKDGPRSWFRFGRSARIDLTVSVPRALALDIEDGSGSLEVRHIRGDVEIEDGSGELKVEDVDGSLRIEDGSGSIEVLGVTGGVQVDDGSGSTTLRRIGGQVRVRDGSGALTIEDVTGDVTLESKGSGSVRIANARGAVRR